MRTFVALQEEKRRLLDKAEQLSTSKKTRRDEPPATIHKIQQQQQQQQQLRQQMNDFNRRQHAIVQRMSAKERYKRKIPIQQLKVAPPPRTLSQEETSSPTTTQPSQPLSSDLSIANSSKCIRLSHLEAEVDECRQRLVNFDGWKRLADEMQKDIHVYEQFTNMLRGQPVETNTDEEESNQATEPPSEHEQRRNSFKEFAKEIVKQVEECQIQAERNKVQSHEEAKRIEARRQQQHAQAAEETRIRLAQIEEQRARDAEKARIRRDEIDQQYARDMEEVQTRHKRQEAQRAEEERRRREESEERSRESARYLRQFDKRIEDHKWHKEWRSRRQLIEQRRVDQSANAA